MPSTPYRTPKCRRADRSSAGPAVLGDGGVPTDPRPTVRRLVFGNECMTHTPKWMSPVSRRTPSCPCLPSAQLPCQPVAVTGGPGHTIVYRSGAASPMPIRSLLKPFRHMSSWSRASCAHGSRQTRAASRLCMSQPALSRQIRAGEENDLIDEQVDVCHCGYRCRRACSR